MATNLNILFVAPEVSPYSKTGGLGDVTAALPKALRELGHRATVLSPLYPVVKSGSRPMSRRITPLDIRLGRGRYKAPLYELKGQDGVRQLFLDIPKLYDRPGIYGTDGEGYEDNPLRFAVLCRAAVALKPQLDIRFDVIHAHDWQGGMIPLYVKAAKEAEARVPTVFTIHNLAYQGLAPMALASQLGVTKKYLSADGIEFYGQINPMKAGILYADAITTVSPTYAREIQSEEFGAGLHGVLSERSKDIYGILNGADYSIWAPETDSLLPAPFDPMNQNGKRRCRVALMGRFGIRPRHRVPVIGVVSRLVEQKGIDLLVEGLKPLLAEELVQVAILGEGDPALEAACRSLADAFPSAVGVHIGYDEKLAHLVFGGSDMFAMPSRFEPCGLSQIYAMRYGAIPIARDTGGLKDTITSYDPEGQKGTGFLFSEATTDGLTAAFRDALEVYHQVRRWRGLIVNAMEADFSWKSAAQRYVDVFENVMEKS
jgi:starch synthase